MDLKSEIEDALYRYAWAYDEADIDALVDCFTADGSFWTNNGAPAIEGASALREFYRATRGRRTELGTRPRHQVTNVRSELIGDQVTANSYMTLIVTGPDGKAGVECTGRYIDTLAQVDGRWRFAARRLTFDHVPALVR